MTFSVQSLGFAVAAMSLLLLTPVSSGQTQTSDSDAQRAQLGKVIAYDRSKGNCLSCHTMDDGELPGNSGPPLLMMKVRFPERQVLRQQIWDASEANPDSIMPPYGRHRILTDTELDLVVDYIYTL
jgi:sulfur-oxidizing protein SoxX